MAKSKVGYVDGFVLLVPRKNVAEYKKMSRQAGKVWMKHGAISYNECMLEDKAPKFITLTFPKLTKAKSTDTVWFSYVEYRSKAHRNAVNKKVMAEIGGDENTECMDMPFEMKKFSYGGFTVPVGMKN